MKNKDAKIISEDAFEKYLGLISGDSKLKVKCEGSGNDDCNNENDSIENKGDIESKSEFRSAWECHSSEATEIRPDLSGDQAQQSLTSSEILRSASDVDPLVREQHRQQSTDDDLDDTTASVLDFSTSIADGQSGIASPTASKGSKQQLSLRTPSNEVALQTTTDSPMYHDLFGCPLIEHARLPVRCLDPREETTSSTPELAAADRGGPVLERNLFGSEECGAGGDLSSAGGEAVDEQRPTSRTAASDTFPHCNKATAVQEVTTSEESGDSTTSSPASGDLLLRTKEQTSKLQQGHTQRSRISGFLCSALSLSEDTSPQSFSSEESTPGSSCSSKVAQIAAEIESRVARHSGSGQVGAGKRATKPALFPIIYSSASNCNSSCQAARSSTVANEWSESSSLWRAAANEKPEQHQTATSLSDLASSSLSRTFPTGAHNASKIEQQQVCAARHKISGQSNGGRGGAVQEKVSRRTTLLLFIMTSLLLCAALLARVYGLSHFAVALERREAAMQALRHHLLPAQKPRRGRAAATSDTGSADKLDEADEFIHFSDTSTAEKSVSGVSDNTSNVVDQLERRASHSPVVASEIAEKCTAASAVVSTAAADTTGNKQNGVVVVRSIGGVWRRLLARLRRAQQVTSRVLQAPFRLLWRLGRETAVSKEPSR